MANAKGYLAGILFVAVLLVAVIGWGVWSQQSAVTDVAQIKETATVAGTASKTGNAATVKFVAYDREALNNSRAAPSLYVSSNGQLIEDGTAMSASTATSVATTIGSQLKACAFSSSYYGKCKDVTVNAETQPETLDVHALTTTVNAVLYKDGAALASTNQNLTLGASQTGTFDFIKLEVNTSAKAFNFKMLGFDTVASSNISNIKIVGNVDWVLNSKGQASANMAETLSKPKRLRSSLDYAFALDHAVMLHGYDSVKTPVIQFEASGSNPAEAVTVAFIDESMFKSTVAGTSGQILSGVEDDQATPADVGASDFTMTLNIV